MPSQRRVAVVALHFSEYASRLACALASTSNVLLVLFSDNATSELGNKWRDPIIGRGVQLFELSRPTSIVRIVRNAVLLTKALRAFNPNVIHFQEEWRDELVWSWPFWPAVPWVVTVHDPQLHSGTDAARVRFSRHRLYRAFMRRKSTHAITHGAFLARLLEGVCPWLAGHVYVVTHGPLGDWQLARAFVPNRHALLFFGRINEYKGLAVFVDAVIALRRQGIPAVGIVAGRGADLEKHKDEMSNTGYFDIRDRYIASKEIPRLFGEAGVVVLPYIEGTQSGVAAMAIGYGRPIVASAVGSLPELVRHGENGLLVPPQDVNALVSALTKVICDKQTAGVLANGAATLRDGEFSWDSIAVETSRVYDDAIRDHDERWGRLAG